jgi:HEAT repeat protein
MVKVLPLTLSQKIEISKLRGIESEEFIQSMKEKYEVMTSTPLYLSMFIELFKTHQKCPDNRSQLYSKAIDDMIQMHVRKLRRNSGQGSILNSDHYVVDLLEMLTQIANSMHSRRNVYFSTNDIDKTFLRSYPLWNEVKGFIDEGQLSFFVSDKNRYKFTHLSFQEYLTSTKWNDKIKEEISGKLAKRNSIATLFSLGFTLESKTPFLDVVCNDFISDPWFRDTFCFLSTQLSSTDFTLFSTHFLNQKRSLSSISVIFDMLRERNCRDKEASMYKSISVMINFKKEKGKVNTVACGMIHPNKYIRNLAEEMCKDFQIDSDFMQRFLFGYIRSESGDGESIGIALRNVLKQNPLIQIKIISDVITMLNKGTSRDSKLYFCKILEHLPLEFKSDEESKLRQLIIESLLHLMDNMNDKKILLQAAGVLINFIDKKENHRDIAEYILKRIFFKNSNEILELSHKKFRVQRDKLLIDFRKVIEGDEEAYIMKALNRIRSDEYSLSYLVLLAVCDKDSVKIIKTLLTILDGGIYNRNSMIMALEALHGTNPPQELLHEISEKLIDIFGNSPWFVRDKACDCIIKFCKRGDSQVLESIESLLKSDIKFRSKLLRMLGKIAEKDDKRAIKLLIPYLDDDKFDVRSEAISAVANICSKLDKELFDKFVSLWEKDENTTVICALASSWPEIIQRGEIGAKGILELLYTRLNHIDPLVKINICAALAKCSNFGDEVTIGLLFKMLDNSGEHINVRAVAANTITELSMKIPEIRSKIIDCFIRLFKTDKLNISYHGYDMFYGSKWSLQHLGATSDNDIIFTQIYRLLRSDSSGEGKSLSKEQIEAITKVNCLESNFILLLMNKERKL